MDAIANKSEGGTSYFGAVSDMTANLANMDIPVFGGAAGFGPDARDFLNTTSQEIFEFNEGQFSKVMSGEITERGQALDMRLVRDEQVFLQGRLNKLAQSNPALHAEVISGMNTNANRTDVAGALNSITDPNIAQAANMARGQLGRLIDFNNINDRTTMGNNMALVRRFATNMLPFPRR